MQKRILKMFILKPQFVYFIYFIVFFRNKEDGSSEPKLKINPLFDLSKRNPVSEEAGSTFFIGNLPNNTRIMELKKLFAKYGLIYKVKLKQKKIRTPKQSDENGGVATESETVNAIIKFKTLKSSEAVLNMNGILYKDHHLRVTLSKDKPNIEKEKSVFVGNLAFSKCCFLNSFLLNKYKKL